ncbi:type II toxin-antitoxin system RelE/ParE family toxin [Nocardia sp. NPDC020380]|uniref:type II toxin-antitoxin system RelE/ParE family toxin n=1 Tax=Nocardia sp. NPDC020380 TaxID=3364309 RepID=UPI003789FA59
MADQDWDIYVVDEVREWIMRLEESDFRRVVQAIDLLAELGPGLARPLVDTITGSAVQNLKELRPGNVRILFVFDPMRSAILLVGGNKYKQWHTWYRTAIPLAEDRYETYLKERREEMEGPQ